MNVKNVRCGVKSTFSHSFNREGLSRRHQKCQMTIGDEMVHLQLGSVDIQLCGERETQGSERKYLLDC